MIRAAFPADRRRNASMSPAMAVSAASPTARSDQSRVPSFAFAPAAGTVRGSRCRRNGDSSWCRSSDAGFAACARARPADLATLRSTRANAGPDSAWTTVLCGVELIADAVGEAVATGTCGASPTLPLPAPRQQRVRWRSRHALRLRPCPCVRAAGATVATGIAFITGGAVTACAESATGEVATSATGADRAADGATRGGRKAEGST